VDSEVDRIASIGTGSKGAYLEFGSSMGSTAQEFVSKKLSRYWSEHFLDQMNPKTKRHFQRRAAALWTDARDQLELKPRLLAKFG
jgi:hypothetical protein